MSFTKKNGEGATVFVEIKTATGKIKKSQLRFMARWSGFCGFARTADEAYALASNPAKHALTRAQKDKLAAFYTTMAAKEISFSVIEKLLGE